MPSRRPFDRSTTTGWNVTSVSWTCFLMASEPARARSRVWGHRDGTRRPRHSLRLPHRRPWPTYVPTVLRESPSSRATAHWVSPSTQNWLQELKRLVPTHYVVLTGEPLRPSGFSSLVAQGGSTVNQGGILTAGGCRRACSDRPGRSHRPRTERRLSRHPTRAHREIMRPTSSSVASPWKLNEMSNCGHSRRVSDVETSACSSLARVASCRRPDARD